MLMEILSITFHFLLSFLELRIKDRLCEDAVKFVIIVLVGKERVLLESEAFLLSVLDHVLGD